jgi:hypothetical protein
MRTGNMKSKPPVDAVDRKNPKQTGSLGGHARAERMTPEQRSSAARKAAQALWSCPKEIAHGELEMIPGSRIPCAVLDNGMRVLSTRGVSRVFGYRKTGTNTNRTGAPQPPPFMASESVKPFISDDLMVRLKSPIIYRPKVGGRTAYGFDCSVFPDVCKVIVAADDAGALKSQQRPLARVARLVIDALIGVAMISLVDEATGYQAERARDDLQKILKAYVCPEMLPWLQRFPEEFFKETYKVMGWTYKAGSAKHPGFVGHIINDWIYKRLPTPVLPELNRVNPVIDGNRRRKHHQHLTLDTGIPHLDRQIGVVTAFMRASSDRRQLEELLVRAFPVPGDQMPLGTATKRPRG